MVASKEDIEIFIPQRTPFVFIDNLLEATPEIFKTDFQILPDNIFIENGVLREFALIENIAQSSSAGLAFTRMSSDKKINNGFIGGISNLKIFELPKANDRIITIVHLIAQMGNMFLFKGENFLHKKKLLECEIKLAVV
jgi:predicted hotdog family 3-hydroxylacyl-ACP dehydratase